MKKDKNGFYRESWTVNGIRYDVRAKDKKELHEKVKAKNLEIERGTKAISENINVRTWGKQWVDIYKSNVSKQTKNLIKGRLEKYIYPHLGYTPVSKVRPIYCQECLNACSGLATDTVKKIKQLLFSLFRDAQKNNLCKDNPASDLTLPKTTPQSTHRSITARERLILLETAKTHPAGAWVLLLLYTGLRPGESIVLTHADIRNGVVSVNKAYDRSTGKVKSPKSKAGNRIVPIIPQLAEVLPVSDNFSNLVFTNTKKRQHTEKSMSRMWRSFRDAMQQMELQLIENGVISKLSETLPPIVPYDLRHTYCTDLERAGVPINIASKLMGHSSIALTSKIYTHTQNDTILNAGAMLSALLTPTVTPTIKGQKGAKNIQTSDKSGFPNLKQNLS